MKKTNANANNDVKCVNCAHLMFSDCYGECSKGYKGIVSPNDSCGRGEPKTPKEPSGMTITRDGQKITLSPEELRKAHELYEKQCDLEDIRNALEERGFPVSCAEELLVPLQKALSERDDWVLALDGVIEEWAKGKSKRVHISNIEWDTESTGDAESTGGLPSELTVVLPLGMEEEDYLSDIFGFCVKGFSVDILPATDDPIHIRNLSADICSVFEDLLDRFDITLPDKDREGDEDEARIYGDTYSDMEDEVTGMLEDFLKEHVPSLPIDATEY